MVDPGVKQDWERTKPFRHKIRDLVNPPDRPSAAARVPGRAHFVPIEADELERRETGPREAA